MSGGGGSRLTSSQKPTNPAGETIPGTLLGAVLTVVNLRAPPHGLHRDMLSGRMIAQAVGS
jgi:hypothetical protein